MKQINKIILFLALVVIFLSAGTFLLLHNNFDVKNITTLIQPKISEREQSLITNQNERFNEIFLEYNEKTHTINSPYIKVNPYGMNELSALVKFETEIPAKISYTVLGDIPFELSIEGFNEIHEIPIICLYEDRDNEVTISIEYEDETVESRTVFIKTDKISGDFATKVSKNDGKDDYFMLAITMNPMTAQIDPTVWLDSNGEVRFYMPHGFSAGMIFTEEGTILTNPQELISKGTIEGYSNGIIEMDYLGRIINYYKVPYEVHHSFIELPNNNLLVATGDESSFVEDSIVEIDRNSGEIVSEWDLKKILDRTRDSVTSKLATSDDWIHVNSMIYDESNNAIIISARHQSSIVSIDKDSADINWILSENEGYSEELAQYVLEPIGENFSFPYAQHSLCLAQNGNLLMFDNGNNRRGESGETLSYEENYSRAVEYKIDDRNMTVEQVYEFGKELGSEKYSSYMSSVSELHNGNLLINFGAIVENADSPIPFLQKNSSYIVEVDATTNEIVRELTFPKVHSFLVEEIDLPNEIAVSENMQLSILYDNDYYIEKIDSGNGDHGEHGLQKFIEIEFENEISRHNDMGLAYTIVNNETGQSYKARNFARDSSGFFTEIMREDKSDLVTFCMRYDTTTLPPGEYTVTYDLFDVFYSMHVERYIGMNTLVEGIYEEVITIK